MAKRVKPVCIVDYIPCLFHSSPDPPVFTPHFTTWPLCSWAKLFYKEPFLAWHPSLPAYSHIFANISLSLSLCLQTSAYGPLKMPFYGMLVCKNDDTLDFLSTHAITNMLSELSLFYSKKWMKAIKYRLEIFVFLRKETRWCSPYFRDSCE